MFEDKTIVCTECGKEFIFTARDQEFYAEKGYTNEPKRCRECRNARKRAAEGKESFKTVCSKCGKEAIVPFIPQKDTPVYCSECFREMHKR